MMESIDRTVFVRVVGRLIDASDQSRRHKTEARVRTFVFLARHGAHPLLGVPQKTMVPNDEL